MAGGIIQLAAKGYEDVILTSEPEITMFKIIYRRTTNFASEPVRVNFDGVPDFGKTISCDLKKNGDLLHKVYLCLTLPALLSFYPNSILRDIELLFHTNNIIVIKSDTNGVLFDNDGHLITVYYNGNMATIDDYVNVIGIINSKLHSFIDYNQIYNILENTFNELINAGTEINSLSEILAFLIEVLTTYYVIPDDFFYFIVQQIQSDSVSQYVVNYETTLKYYIYHTLLTNIFPSVNDLFRYVLQHFNYNIDLKTFFDISYKNNYILASLMKIYNNTTNSHFLDYINSTLIFNITIPTLEGKTFDEIFKMVNSITNTTSVGILQNLFKENSIIPIDFTEFNHLYKQVFKNTTIPAKSIISNVSRNLNYHVYNNYYVIYNLIKLLLFNAPIIFTKVAQMTNTFTDNIVRNSDYTESNDILNDLNKLRTTVHALNFDETFFNLTNKYNGKKNLVTVDPVENVFGTTNDIPDITFSIYAPNRYYDAAYNNIIDSFSGVTDINPAYNNTSQYAYNQWFFTENFIFKNVSYNLSSISNPITITSNVSTDARNFFSFLTPNVTVNSTIVPPISGGDTDFNIFNKPVFLNYLQLDKNNAGILNLPTRTLDSLYSCETSIKFLKALSIPQQQLYTNSNYSLAYPHHDFVQVKDIPVVSEPLYTDNITNIINQIKNIPFANDLVDAIQIKKNIFIRQMETNMNNIFGKAAYTELFNNTKIWYPNVVPVDINSTLLQTKGEFFNFNLNVSFADTYQHIHDIHIRLLNSIIPVTTGVAPSIVILLQNITAQYNKLYELKYKAFLLKLYTHYGGDLKYFPIMTNFGSFGKFMFNFKKEQFIDLDFIVKDFLQIIENIRFPAVISSIITTQPFGLMLGFCEIKKFLNDYTYYAQLILVNVYRPDYPIKIEKTSHIVADSTDMSYLSYTYQDFLHEYTTGGWTDSVIYIINTPQTTAIVYENLKLSFLYDLNYSFLKTYNDMMNGIFDSSFIDDTVISNIIYNDTIVNADIINGISNIIGQTPPAPPSYNNNGNLFDQNNLGFMLFNAGYETSKNVKNTLNTINTNSAKYNIDDRIFTTNTVSTSQSNDVSTRAFSKLTPVQINNILTVEGTFNIVPNIITVSPTIIDNSFDIIGLTINTIPDPVLGGYLDYYRLSKVPLYVYDYDGARDSLTYFDFISNEFVTSLNITQLNYFQTTYMSNILTNLQKPINYGGSFLTVLFSIINKFVFENNTYLFFNDMINTYSSSILLKDRVLFESLPNIFTVWKNNTSKYIDANLTPLQIAYPITYFASSSLTQAQNEITVNGISPIEYNVILSNQYLTLIGSTLSNDILLPITTDTLFKDVGLITLQFETFRKKTDYLFYIIYLIFLGFFNSDLFATLLKNDTLNTSFIANNLLSTFARLINIINNYTVLETDVSYQLGKIMGRNATARNAWIRKLGNFIVEESYLEIGGQIIDRHYADYYNMWSEISQEKGTQKSYDIMTGDLPELNNFNNIIKKQYLLYLPLYFSFCRHIGLSLPLVAAQYQSIKIYAKLRTFEQCSFSDNGSQYLDEGVLHPYMNSYFNLYGSKISQVNNLDPNVLTNINALDKYYTIPKLGESYVIGNYIYLDNDERKIFSEKKHEYLIECVQYAGNLSVPTSSETNFSSKYLDNELNVTTQSTAKYLKVDVPLKFNNCVKYILFAVRMDKHISENIRRNTAIGGNINDYYDDEKQYYNYGSESYRKSTDLSIIKDQTTNPIKYANLKFFSKERTQEYTSGEYYRLVQPFQHISNSVQQGLCLYSFALRPLDIEPSGAVNMSRVDDMYLTLYLDPTITNINSAQIIIYGVGYNIHRYMSGMSGLAFV